MNELTYSELLMLTRIAKARRTHSGLLREGAIRNRDYINKHSDEIYALTIIITKLESASDAMANSKPGQS